MNKYNEIYLNILTEAKKVYLNQLNNNIKNIVYEFFYDLNKKSLKENPRKYKSIFKKYLTEIPNYHDDKIKLISHNIYKKISKDKFQNLLRANIITNTKILSAVKVNKNNITDLVVSIPKNNLFIKNVLLHCAREFYKENSLFDTNNKRYNLKECFEIILESLNNTIEEFIPIHEIIEQNLVEYENDIYSDNEELDKESDGDESDDEYDRRKSNSYRKKELEVHDSSDEEELEVHDRRKVDSSHKKELEVHDSSDEEELEVHDRRKDDSSHKKELEVRDSSDDRRKVDSSHKKVLEVHDSSDDKELEVHDSSDDKELEVHDRRKSNSSDEEELEVHDKRKSNSSDEEELEVHDRRKVASSDNGGSIKEIKINKDKINKDNSIKEVRINKESLESSQLLNNIPKQKKKKLIKKKKRLKNIDSPIRKITKNEIVLFSDADDDN